MYKILVVDDDYEMLKRLRTILEMRNYEVTTYEEVSVPLVINDFKGFDLILLDVLMPNIDGIEICKRIRDEVDTPIVFVSALDSERDIIAGLKSGGDDYITKPFSVHQLVAKIAAHLKREERHKASREKEIAVRELLPVTFYLQEKQVCINGEIVPLTRREYDILELLSRNTNKVYTKKDIYEYVYDDKADALFHSISEYIYQIRGKFSPYGINPIRTIRGMGYKWYNKKE
ncbi:response regulator transcription factor [Streptococcus suis]|uniref:response regulator transcription factor n=1 Tax=Streptococcus suis TaxID=1307 RepID=UPI002AA2D768|nr:response regulator transcription factor [Streptococcus suis]HEM4423389.1 response regulator transcription factor [Streptococcus suis]